MRNGIVFVILLAFLANTFASEDLSLTGMRVKLGYDLHEPTLICNLSKEALRSDFREKIYKSINQTYANNKSEWQLSKVNQIPHQLQFEWKGKLIVNVRRNSISILYHKKF